jgi:serine/threonine protein kinase
MGQEESQRIKNQIQTENKFPLLSKTLFDFLYVIGRGGFGKVWKVQYKRTQKKYALKEMSKVKIIDRKSEKSIKSEREFLSYLHHPFIVNMKYSFQDYDNLYLVMDLLTGGDLRYHLCGYHKFSENQTKFFIACVILGLEYIHNNNIIHRDIKPENLVCDENGYIRITDFGVAKIKKKDNSSETSGTPGYMAPEVLMGQNHSFTVDFFAIGIMGYEFMFGKRPYLGKNRKEIKHLIVRKQAKINQSDLPYNWSVESMNFINECLKRKENKRLGFNYGIIELKNHSWFKNFEWNKIYNKIMPSPFIPKKEGNYDKKYCEGPDKISQKTLERYQSYYQRDDYNIIFNGYTYIYFENENEDFGNIYTKNIITKSSTNATTSTLNNNNNNINGNESKLKIKYNKMKDDNMKYINNLKLSGEIKKDFLNNIKKEDSNSIINIKKNSLINNRLIKSESMNNIAHNFSPINYSLRNLHNLGNEKNLNTNHQKNNFRGTLYNYKVNDGKISKRETPYLPIINLNNTGNNFWKFNEKLKINSLMNRNNLSKLKIRNKILSPHHDFNIISKQLKRSESLGLINKITSYSPKSEFQTSVKQSELNYFSDYRNSLHNKDD